MKTCYRFEGVLKMAFNRALDAMNLGRQGVITRVDGEPSFRRRLMEMGLVPGTPVCRTGQAPLGDPLRFRVRGMSLSLRRADAALIGWEPVGGQG